MAAIVNGRPVLYGPPPYAPLTWPLGGFPSISVDVAIMAVFIFLFSIAASIHLFLFLANLFRAHRFFISFLLFFFCLERIVTLSLRIASTILGTNGKLYVAHIIMLYGGTPLLYIINFMFAHRIIRAQHPVIGMLATILFLLIYLSIIITWGMLVSGLVQPFYRFEGWIRNIDRGLRIYGFTFFAFLALLPILLVAVSSCIPRVRRTKKFGAGSMYAKIMVLIIISLLCALEAFYIAGAEWMNPVSRFLPQPNWMSRAWYYTMIWLVEFIIVVLYALGRVDQRFHHKRDEVVVHENHRDTYRSSKYVPSGAAGVAIGAAPARKTKRGGLLGGRFGGSRGGRFGGGETGGSTKKGGGLKKVLFGAGAAGAGAAALHHFGKKKDKKRTEKEMDHEIDRAASPMSPITPTAPITPVTPVVASRDMPVRHDPLGSHPPYKEVRGFDAETIPEETETEDSLFAGGSSIMTESKRTSVVSGHEEMKPVSHHPPTPAFAPAAVHYPNEKGMAV